MGNYSSYCHTSRPFHHVGFNQNRIYEEEWERYSEEPKCSGNCSDCPVIDCENNETEEKE